MSAADWSSLVSVLPARLATTQLLLLLGGCLKAELRKLNGGVLAAMHTDPVRQLLNSDAMIGSPQGASCRLLLQQRTSPHLSLQLIDVCQELMKS
jgi:hypothetical protein